MRTLTRRMSMPRLMAESATHLATAIPLTRYPRWGWEALEEREIFDCISAVGPCLMLILAPLALP